MIDHERKQPAKRGRGSAPIYEMPERIDASPEEVAHVVLRDKPKKKWPYMERVELQL